MIRVAFSAAADLPQAVAAAREALAGHGVIALPTETFYGLAVDPDDAEAVARVFAIKGRMPAKALPIVAAGIGQVARLVALEPRRRAALAAVWPAAVTVVLPLLRPLAAAPMSAAVRVPDHALLRSLLARVGPLTATSANRSGAPPCTRAEVVAASLGAFLELLLDGGDTPGGSPSTVVDWTGDAPRLLRSGVWRPPEEWGMGPM